MIYLGKFPTTADCLLLSKSQGLPAKVEHNNSGSGEGGTRIGLDLDHYREVLLDSSKSCQYSSQVLQTAFASVRQIVVSI